MPRPQLSPFVVPLLSLSAFVFLRVLLRLLRLLSLLRSPIRFFPLTTLVCLTSLCISPGCDPPARPGGVAPSSDSSPLPHLPVARGVHWDRVDDAGADGWDTEVVAAAVSARLKELAAAFLEPGGPGTEKLSLLADPGCVSSELLPADLALAYEEGDLRVLRWHSPQAPTPGRSTGTAALAAALGRLRSRWDPGATLRFEPKVFGIERSARGAMTRQALVIVGPSGGRRVEHNAEWRAEWALPRGGSPTLLELDLQTLELVEKGGSAPLLVEATPSALGGSPAYGGQLLRGLNHWLERLQENRFFALLGTPGLAVGDTNGDGLEDLYVCQEGGLPNLLFLGRPDGTALEGAKEAGVDWIDSTRSALLVDLDNDRDVDLAAAVLGALVVAENDGRGHFTVRLTLPTSLDTMSLSAADADLDGDLDLYLCVYKPDDLVQDAGVLSIGASSDFVYHDSNSGAPNVYFRNDIQKGGPWALREATQEVGLDANNRRFSFAAAWEDHDDDGDPDLYVANDFGRNNLYRNGTAGGPPGHFEDVAREAGAEDSASGMGVAWGDYNRDGKLDIYVSNMFSAAGSRITTQTQFKADATPEVRERLRRFARGNTLLRNLGNGTFEDVSELAQVTMGRWAWSSSFLDLNNDGWEDLVVANGYVTTEDTGDL